MGRSDEYERTLLRVAELLGGGKDEAAILTSEEWSPSRLARFCFLVVDGMNLESAERVSAREDSWPKQ